MTTNEISTIDIGTLICSIAAIIVSVISIYSENRGKSVEVYISQLERVYFPLFRHISTTFHNEPSNNEILAFVELLGKTINDNAMLCHYELLEYHDLLSKNISNKDYRKELYINACTHIDTYYDKLCRRVNLPVRSASYRIRYKHFFNTMHKTEYIIKFSALVLYKVIKYVLLTFTLFVGILTAALVLLQPLLQSL